MDFVHTMIYFFQKKSRPAELRAETLDAIAEIRIQRYWVCAGRG